MSTTVVRVTISALYVVFTTVVGVPARVIRFRQPAEIAERLQDLAWWDWDHETLRARLDDFRALSAAEFLDRYEA